MFSYNRGFNHHGITYKGQLDLHPGEVHLDFYPFGHGLHLNPGLLVYNGNGATANANVPGNSTFSLGGATYLSDPTNPSRERENSISSKPLRRRRLDSET
jgi:hypothetical protein